MKLVIQKVDHASVTVDEKVVGTIKEGLLLLVGFGEGDTETDLDKIASKVVNMRLFPEGESYFHKSLLDVQGEVLAISQFTLYADVKKGRRPDFFAALKPELASSLFDKFVDALKRAGASKVETGIFGAHMLVDSCNNGPVTIIM